MVNHEIGLNGRHCSLEPILLVITALGSRDSALSCKHLFSEFLLFILVSFFMWKYCSFIACVLKSWYAVALVAGNICHTI